MKNKRIHRKYKDRVFRIIFRDKKELPELYNVVNDSAYTNPDELTITTIEDVVYMGMKNDLSFIIGDVMNLYEHQSSYSPNLPLIVLLCVALSGTDRRCETKALYERSFTYPVPAVYCFL